MMDLGEDFAYSFPTDRKCRVCGETKSLIEGFYITRKHKGTSSSAYSYECKLCTIARISTKKRRRKKTIFDEYPDW